MITDERSQNDILEGTGVETVIPFQFNYFPNTNIGIVVTLRDETDPDNITETVLTEGTDYDLYDDRIELANALLPLQFLLVERVVMDLQPLDYEEIRPFPAEVHEKQEDRTFMSLSEIKNKFKRTILYNKFMSNEIVVEDPVDGQYLFYRYDAGTDTWTLSSSSATVDLTDFYTRSEIDAFLLAKEDTIVAGLATEYYRGDKSWATLDKDAVGLDQVDNTSDADKPISIATQLALGEKLKIANLQAGTNVNITGTGTDVDPLVVSASGGLTTVSWGDIDGDISDQTDLQAALSNKEDTIPTGTTAQYIRGDKTLATLNKAAVGLGNVDNTSDLNKPISTATQSALNDKLDTADAYRDSMVAGLEIDFNSATQYTSIASNVTYTMANNTNGRTTVLSVTNIDSAARTVTFPGTVKARADINYSVEPGETNIYTFVVTGGVTYVACVDGLV